VWSCFSRLFHSQGTHVNYLCVSLLLLVHTVFAWCGVGRRLAQTCWCRCGILSRSTSTCSRRRLSIAFSDLDQYVAVSDPSRHVGIDGVFFQYLSQVWSCFSRLFQSFFFLRVGTRIIYFLLLLLCAHPSLLLVVPTLLTCLNVYIVHCHLYCQEITLQYL